MEFSFLIVGIILFVLIFNLRSRVHALEKTIKNLETSDGSKSKSENIGLPNYEAAFGEMFDYIKGEQEMGVSNENIKKELLLNGWQSSDIEKVFKARELALNPSLEKPSESMSANGFIDWLKEDWMLKLGAILLLIGFAWLATYAFLNNWIGPMGRIAIGVAAGTLFLILGWWRIKKYVLQGSIFLALGSSTILLTVFAARSFYDFFTPGSALLLMFLSTAFVALASVKFKSKALSILSLLLAGLVPILTNAPSTDHIGLFAYLLVVILGAIWIVTLTGQKSLNVLSLVIFAIYSFPHFVSPHSFPQVDMSILLLFAYAFATVFFLTNVISLLKSKVETSTADLFTAGGNGLLLLIWIYLAAPKEWQSLIIVAWMLVFSAAAFLVFKITKKREAFYIYTGVGVAMLAAATAIELEGAALTIAYTIETGVVSLLAYYLWRDLKIVKNLSLLLIGPMILSVESMGSYAWENGVFHKDFFVLLILSVTLFILGIFFVKFMSAQEKNDMKFFNPAFFVAGSFYAYVLLWLSLQSALVNDNLAVMISLVVYTIIALISYFYGLRNDKTAFRLYGAFLIGFVVIRLLFVDIWKMELSGRIITFFLIGALLVSTAFVRKKKVQIDNN